MEMSMSKKASTLHNTIRSLRPALRARSVRMRCGQVEVLAPFVELMATHVCASSPFKECSVYLPPLEDQMRILTALQEIATYSDIAGLQGTFLKLLIAHDDQAVSYLLERLTEYTDALDAIRDVVEHANTLVGVFVTSST